MALSTYSKFYYGFSIDDSNCNLDFFEGSTRYLAILNQGSYSLTDFISEVSRAMNAAGGQAYSLVLNRSTRHVTISASSSFKIPLATGLSISTSGYPLLGFRGGSDLTGANSYVSDSGAGYSYNPQFLLQSYVPTSSFKKTRDGTVKKATDGSREVVGFGTEKYMECEILFISNVPQPSWSPIRSNQTGYEDAVNFLDFVITGAPVEFIVDENSPNSFEKLILVTTDADQNGLSYKLVEEYDKNFPEYFKSGKLTWLLQE